MNVLGIETSCDETSVAVVRNGRQISSNVVASQVELHRKYGGIFPEMASRQHVLSIGPVFREALFTAGVTWPDIDAVAVTYGPGLAGSLVVGVNFAKALARAHELPFLGVNHLEGHIYSAWMQPAADAPIPDIRFPALILIVSGGHTELVLMHDHGTYELLGQTLDDAAGEAFDKVARLLGLAYPGGPEIQSAAEGGDPTAFDFPRAWLPETYDFSFSGLKTAVLREVEKYRKESDNKDSQASFMPVVVREVPVPHIAASFQRAVVDVLVGKTLAAATDFDVQQVVVAGGVAANRPLREQIQSALAEEDIPLLIAPLALCTDNAAMIAGAAYWRLRQRERSTWDLDVVPNLPLVAQS